MVGDIDFSSFDFGDSEPEIDSKPKPTQPAVALIKPEVVVPPVVKPVEKKISQGLDFSDDDMFGAVVQSEPEPTKETISFDFDSDSFSESMDAGAAETGSKKVRGKSGSMNALGGSGEAPFNLGEIDFGEDLTSVAVHQVNPNNLKASQEVLFAPLADAHEKSTDNDLVRSFIGDESATNTQDLPPLSITSRRKQNPLFVGAIAVALLIIVAIVGYFSFSSRPTPKDAVVTDSGKISVRAIAPSYIENDNAGELLVISGEAVNEYPKPRAALQVKVTVFDGKGQVVATKVAYSGNPLTEEQLNTLTLEKLESAMANQFGDSLANMEVAPGKAIPFVVVLANLPKNAKDFSVQSDGSTVATVKQQ